MTSGIYKITNKANGKIYVGSSNDIEGRWYGHVKDLNNNKHHSKHLQRAWNKYGEASFAFEIIEILNNRGLLIEYEQFYLDLLEPFNKVVGYNICSTAGSSFGVRRSKKTRMLLSRAAKEQKINRFRMKGPESANWGRKHTEEFKKNISERTLGENNPFYGKKHSNEVIDFISNFNKGKFVGEDNLSSKLKNEIVKEIIIGFHTGKYDQIELAEKYDTDQTNVSLIVHGKTWKHVYENVMKEHNNFADYNIDFKAERYRKIANKNAKLTEEQVIEIRQLRKDTGWSCKAIADIYNVKKNAIVDIIGGKTWKHLISKKV